MIIGKNVSIRNSIILCDSEIKDDSIIESSIIGFNVIISSNTHVMLNNFIASNVVIAPGSKVPSNSYFGFKTYNSQKNTYENANEEGKIECLTSGFKVEMAKRHQLLNSEKIQNVEDLYSDSDSSLFSDEDHELNEE